jgi:hypothetical protein
MKLNEDDHIKVWLLTVLVILGVFGTIVLRFTK